MKTSFFGLRLIAAMVASGALLFSGCGDDDDDNDTPSNTTGGKTNRGGATGSGGTANAGESGDGGTTTSKGGTTSTVEGGNTGEGGGPVGGSAGAGAGGGATEGGAAGGGNIPTAAPCEEISDGENCSYPTGCEPQGSAAQKHEQLLNRCPVPGVECTPFDNSTLESLNDNGELPPLPAN